MKRRGEKGKEGKGIGARKATHVIAQDSPELPHEPFPEPLLPHDIVHPLLLRRGPPLKAGSPKVLRAAAIVGRLREQMR